MSDGGDTDDSSIGSGNAISSTGESGSNSESSDDLIPDNERSRIRALEARSTVLRLEQQSVRESNEQIQLILTVLIRSLLRQSESGQPVLVLDQLREEQLELLQQLVAIEDRLAELRAQIGEQSDSALERELRRANESSHEEENVSDDDQVIPIENDRLERRLRELLDEQRQQHLGETVARIEEDDVEDSKPPATESKP